MRKFLLSLFAVMLLSFTATSQKNFFQSIGQNASVTTSGKRELFPTTYGLFSTDISALKAFLWSLPAEKDIRSGRSNAGIILMPMPDGKSARFKVWESNVMEQGLASKFPDMRQFLGQGIDDPYATIRFDYNPSTGFHAQILSASTGRIFIDPYANGDLIHYMSFFARDIQQRQRFICEVQDIDYPSTPGNRPTAACLGTTLRTYRLALACTGEYAVAVNGPTPTTTGVAAAMLTAVNRVTGVYETEVSVRLQLVANNNLLIYLDAASDPYTNNNGGTMLAQNQTNCDAVIGNANYDIGHVFSTGGGGIAGLGVICSSSQKARGVTGLPNPVGDAFYIDYVAHEMGHQFGGNHTFNSVTSSCGGGNRNASTAYEVGSGVTIQAYAGICGSDDIQPNSDPYFHGVSFDEISNRVTATTCAATSATGNTLPVINPLLNSGVTIPISTPFVLSGSATDANGDALTYSWEQWDLGASGAWNGGATAAANNTLPLFKPRVPKTTGDRTFPDIAVILAGYPANPAATMNGLKGETLSPVARAMNFRLTVRDNRAGGGGTVSLGGGGCQSSTPFTVNVAGTAPFVVTFPNGGESFGGGSTQTVTWNNASTDVAPFNVANVRITYSTDGGLTYPTVLLASTPNDGSEPVVIPVGSTTTARVRVEAIGNIFFDISNNNFSVTAPVNGFTFNSPAPVTAACPAPNTMTSTSLTATYTGTFTGNISLSGVVNPAGPTVSFSNATLTTGSPSTTVSLTGMSTLSPGNYTVNVTGVGAGGPTITRDIVFTINPGSGPAITGQPANAAVCIGQTATFSVVAIGTYQWQLSTNGGATWTNIGGATTNTLSLTGAANLNNNQYRCIVTGQCGSTTSSAATLTVNPTTAVTSQPVSLALCQGSPASFTIAAAGAGLGYQWEQSTDGGVTWNAIPSANASTLNIASVTTGQNNYQFRCQVTGTCGNATSNAATLQVSSVITISTQPASQTVCEATTINFSSGAAGSGITYQWQVSTDGGTTWTNLSNGGVYSGATSATLTITGVLPAQNGYRFRAVASNGTCTPGISNAATLSVNTFPTINTQPQSVQICAGGNATFSVAATTGVGVLSYQWQFSTNGITYTNIPGATSASYSITGAVVGQNNYVFRVIVTATCGSVNSALALLTVNPFPIVSFNPQSTICKSDDPITLSATPAGGTFSGSGVTGTTFNPTVAGVGAKAINYSVTVAGCTSSAARTILVNECAERHLSIDKFPAIIVYPSPNHGDFNIGISTDIVSKLEIRIYNALGQMIKSQSASGLRYGSVIPVSIAGQPSGTYQVYMINDENGKVTTKATSIVVYR